MTSAAPPEQIHDGGPAPTPTRLDTAIYVRDMLTELLQLVRHSRSLHLKLALGLAQAEAEAECRNLTSRH